MVLGGRLTAQDKVLTVVDPTPRDEIEAAAIRVIGLGPRRRAWRRMDRLGRSPAIAAVGAGLADQGLMGHPARYRAVRRSHDWLFGVLTLSVVMGLTAIGLAVPQGLAVLIPIAATALVWKVGRMALNPGVPWHHWTTDAGDAALNAHDTRTRPWTPPIHDELSAADAALLAEVARDGTMYGKLAPLAEAITWPASPYTGTPINDPPGLGGL